MSDDDDDDDDDALVAAVFPADFPTKLEAGSCLLFPAVWTTPAVGGRLDNITFSLLYDKYTGLYNPLTCSCLRAEGDEVAVLSLARTKDLGVWVGGHWHKLVF